jgi:flavin reductase (DIM6/NTAB) family NADH-FMN oxidoreductase RutF
MELDAEKLDSGDAYRLMNSIIIPRPIAWVSTISRDGKANLAPFSYFNGVGSEPPALSLSVSNRDDGSPKDTLRNIQDTGEFVVNAVPRRLAEAMNATSAELPHGESEFAEAGLAEVPSVSVRPPGVAGSPARMECRLIQVVPVGEANVIIGRIVRFHVEEGILAEARPGKLPTVDAERLDPLARLGGADYARIAERFSMLRPRSPRPPGPGPAVPP